MQRVQSTLGPSTTKLFILLSMVILLPVTLASPAHAEGVQNNDIPSNKPLQQAPSGDMVHPNRPAQVQVLFFTEAKLIDQTKVELTWQRVPGFDYEVRKNERAWKMLKKRPSAIFSNLKPLTTYRFSVRAVNDQGIRSKAQHVDIVTGLPATTNIKAISGTDGSVGIGWDPVCYPVTLDNPDYGCVYAVDFSYRVPETRKWKTVAQTMTADPVTVFQAQPGVHRVRVSITAVAVPAQYYRSNCVLDNCAVSRDISNLQLPSNVSLLDLPHSYLKVSLPVSPADVNEDDNTCGDPDNGEFPISRDPCLVLLPGG
ncbi:MAG: fibronectin type III domain-containing protein [Caldilineaceae bacterium SB0662_bin_9]|uniref:Fibronectin type III domain-containing protein n=1 Tax=Caldilineaceae bacterium SB0662_bin_9 TaxID=2605258 RepID=A0A6B1DX10_9CHLR|nr:fibronectin type III domain-containing protein [Caldilineaceae bacterium SB0662_bin_9]